MNFDIHKVKSVTEVFNEEDAQDYIDEGWTLLAVCPISDGQKSDRCYVLGSYEAPGQNELSSEAKENLLKLEKLIKRN